MTHDKLLAKHPVRKCGISNYFALNFYRTEPALIREMMVKELEMRAEREGYKLDSHPLGIIIGYRKLTDKGFFPVDEELADVVEVHFTAQAIEKELQ